MINKLLVSFLLLFFIGSFLDYLAGGGAGMSCTRLSSDLSETSETIYVMDASTLPRQGIVHIGAEIIVYKNRTDYSLLHCARGYEDTDADAHTANTYVYSDDASAVNEMLGFDIASMASAGGIWAFPLVASNFLFHTMPKLATFDFAFLNWGPFIWFRYCMMLFGIGLIFTFFYFIFIAVGSVASCLFNLRR